jgi:hypothetical protein
MMIPTTGADALVFLGPISLEAMLRIAFWQAVQEAPQYRGQKPNGKRRFAWFMGR